MVNIIPCTVLGKSKTLVSVPAYSDATITITAFTVNSGSPLLDACKVILKQTKGAAKQYKLSVHRGSKLLFTIRSILWGTKRSSDEQIPDYEAIDRQVIDEQQP